MFKYFIGGKEMIGFLHSLGVLFGVAAIAFAVAAVVNSVSASVYPKYMADEAWPYAKKAYKFLGLALLFIALCIVLNLCF